MHEIIAILKKDVRRLWWQVAAMLAMCTTLGCLDAGRLAAQPGVVEGFLNVVLPLVWACLIAEAVHGEALVGDREFWMTRPYRWGRLLGAKALFVAAVVHLPSFLTDAGVLMAHGYNLMEVFPQLLLRQLLLAGGLTLPAMALGGLVSDLTKFVIGVPALCATLGLSLGLRQSTSFVFMVGGLVHLAIVLAGVAGVVILVLQYRQRRTRLARIVALSTLLALGVGTPLTAYWHAPVLTAVELPAADIHATMALQPPGPPGVHEAVTRSVFTILPFKTSGIPDQDNAQMASVRLEIAAANGVRYRYDLLGRKDFHITNLGGMNSELTSLFIEMNPRAYDRIKDSKVTITGSIGFLVYEWVHEVRMPIGAVRKVTRGLHCVGRIEGGPDDGPWLNVYCDTPGPDRVLAEVRIDGRLTQPSRGWFGAVGSPGAPLGWLSPLQRRQQKFGVDRSAKEALDGSPIFVVPVRMAGYSTVSFKATDVDLRGYTK